MPRNTLSVSKPTKWASHYVWWVHNGYATAAELFRDYIMKRPRLIEMAKCELRGKNLACRCPLNEPCHADVLLVIANTSDATMNKELLSIPLKRDLKSSGSRQKAISHSKLSRLTLCNSKKIPRAVNHDGVRKEWVGIGWIACGKPRGDEVLVTG